MIRPECHSQKDCPGRRATQPEGHALIRSKRHLFERRQLLVPYFHDFLEREAKAGSPAGTKVTHQ